MQLKSGQIAPKTCVCIVCNAKGQKIATVAIKKGEILPKTPSINCYYEIAE